MRIGKCRMEAEGRRVFVQCLLVSTLRVIDRSKVVVSLKIVRQFDFFLVLAYCLTTLASMLGHRPEVIVAVHIVASCPVLGIHTGETITPQSELQVALFTRHQDGL